VVVTAVIASGSGTVGGTTTASTNASGLATFSNLKITGTIGVRTLGFSTPGLPAVTSSAVTVTAGAAAQLTITTQPSASVKVNTEFPQQPVIQLRDVSGNAVSQAGVPVTVSVATGPGALSGTTTVNTNSSGVAAFAKLSLGTAGTYTLRFASGVLAAVVSGSIVVTP
jgi:adhesin/invasin